MNRFPFELYLFSLIVTLRNELAAIVIIIRSIAHGNYQHNDHVNKKASR